MPKRFHDTNIWDEDWFLELPTEYQMFFLWIKDRCDHAGIWKANKRKFENTTGLRVDIAEAIKLYNADKERFVKINGNKYLLPDFFVFQYGRIMNLNSNTHLSVAQIYSDLEVSLGSIRGLLGVRLGVKDIDKDIYKDKDNVKDLIKDIKTKKKEVYKKEKSGNSRIEGEDPDGY